VRRHWLFVLRPQIGEAIEENERAAAAKRDARES